MNLKLTCIICFIVNFSFAQEDRIQNYIDLDTSFSFPNSNKFFRDDLALTIFEGNLWIYFPSQRDDTLDFAIINLDDFSMKMVNCVFPSMYLKINSPVSTDMSVSKDFICLSLDGAHKLIVIDRDQEDLKLRNIVPIREHTETFKIIGDYLFFAKIYNYHPNDSRTKTSIGKYNLITGYLENIIQPEFEAIEFSHFSPNNWIDFTENYIIFSQTVRQEFLIYDMDLNLIQTIKNGRPKGWNEYSSTLFMELLDGTSSAKSVIHALENLEDTLYRIESVHFLDNNTFIVQNKPPIAEGDEVYRVIDIWKRSKKGQFELFKSTITDRGFEKTDLITSLNFPIQFNYFTNTFGYGKLIQWRFDAGVNMLGKTLEEVQNEAENFYMDMSKEEVYRLKIFSIHDL